MAQEFNAGQTGGPKTVNQLKVKYKNLKAETKKQLASNSKEMMKTGGGSASIDLSNDFEFSEKQISGLVNPFDSDNIEIEDFADNSIAESQPEHVPESPSEMKSKIFVPKKKRMALKQNDLVTIKEEGMKLDNQLKREMIRKTGLENDLLELQKKKVRLEITKLETNTEPKIFCRYIQTKPA